MELLLFPLHRGENRAQTKPIARSLELGQTEVAELEPHLLEDLGRHGNSGQNFLLPAVASPVERGWLFSASISSFFLSLLDPGTPRHFPLSWFACLTCKSMCNVIIL